RRCALVRPCRECRPKSGHPSLNSVIAYTIGETVGGPAMRFPAIGHIDADCYYASAERVRDPYLATMPLAVLGNQGAAVIAKSYEMKERGVKTGEPIWDAVKK